MAARPPKALDLLGKEYTVRVDHMMRDLDAASGKCMPSKCLILLAGDQDVQQQRDTLLHELLHGLWSEMGLSEEVKDEHEETIVRRLGTALLYVLRANPELMDYLLGE